MRLPLDQTLTPISLALVWLTIAGIMGVLLLLSSSKPIAADDADLAYQRPGFLLPANRFAPKLTSSIPQKGRRTVVLLKRTAPTKLFSDKTFESQLASKADLVLITADGTRVGHDPALKAQIADSNKALAAKLIPRIPVDKGYPIGYAIIDSKGFLRYYTLDPFFSSLSDEIEIMLKATP